MAEATSIVFPAHRAYRRLGGVTRASVIRAIAILVIAEAGVIASVDWIVALVGHAAFGLLPQLAPPATLVTTTYVGVRLKVLSIVFPNTSYWVELIWLAAGATLLAMVLRLRIIPTPMRVFAGFGSVLVCASAYYAMVIGPPGFDGYEASALYIRTAVVIWLLLPIVLTALSVGLPFSVGERLVLIVVCVVADMGLAIVRYAFFVWIIGVAGPIPMPMLYLLFGPALDFMSVVAISSVVLVHLSKRLDRVDDSERWLWT
jgi:hypothetical protein